MAGSLVGQIINGEYTKTAASTEATKSSSNMSTSKTSDSKGTQYNEEMFLQLLVAEMQYQDPLEPSDNSEYVSQLASFTQIEAIQSVQSDMQTIQANSLVGKVVIMNHDNEMISGKVDYVTSDDGKLYLSIDDKQYDIDELTSVVDGTYYTAAVAANTLSDMVAKLPPKDNVTLADEESITEAATIFDSMDSYTQGFIEDSTVNKLKEVYDRLQELKKAKEQADKNNEVVAEVNQTAESKEVDDTTTTEGA